MGPGQATGQEGVSEGLGQLEVAGEQRQRAGPSLPDASLRALWVRRLEDAWKGVLEFLRQRAAEGTGKGVHGEESEEEGEEVEWELTVRHGEGE